MQCSAADDWSDDVVHSSRHEHPHVSQRTADSTELFERLRRGDETAMESLYLAYYDRLLRFAYTLLRSRQLAEEVVQEVFLRLWQRRESVKMWESGAAYLYSAVRNQAFKVARHRTVVERSIAPEMAKQTPAGMGEHPLPADERVEGDELAARVARAIAALPERRREALTLRWRHQLPYADIAAILGVSVSAATILVARARDEVAALVREYSASR